jgi:hypothetical protein
MFDFVSIVYNNKIEIDLLKIQLYSFKFIDINIINNIYILFNDSKDKNKLFETEYNNSIEQFIPLYLKEKVKIIFITDLISLNTIYQSDWFTQQFAKIYVSKIINSKYYIMLDTKNIFIKQVDISTFITDDKIKMYLAVHNDDLLNYYNNCFNYFEIKNIESCNPYNHPLYIQTTTPFVFITEECKNLIDYVENKENINFYEFFFRRKYTEFFLYYAWLNFVNKKDHYVFLHRTIDNTIIGPHDPIECGWNSWESKINYIKDYKPSVFSISSKCITIIDDNYKNNIKEFLNKIFHDEIVNIVVEKILYP